MGDKMLLISSRALPDIYLKVLDAKKLIASGAAKTASDASKMCGISRSAYYKYKDLVFEYNNPLGKIISLQAVLRDTAGVLSAFLTELYGCGCNILTVNQSLPASGTASVSVSMRIPTDDFDVEKTIITLLKIDGVVSVKRTPHA